jgi:septal ring factor EnvC (AmiA/AmiB activator)
VPDHSSEPAAWAVGRWASGSSPFGKPAARSRRGRQTATSAAGSADGTAAATGIAEHADPAAQPDARGCRTLRAIVAELATVNTGLRSIQTELRCAQHELIATNDELRIVHDELRAAHAYLISVNEQLRIRADKQAHNRTLVEAALNAIVGIDPTAAEQTRS